MIKIHWLDLALPTQWFLRPIFSLMFKILRLFCHLKPFIYRWNGKRIKVLCPMCSSLKDFEALTLTIWGSETEGKFQDNINSSEEKMSLIHDWTSKRIFSVSKRWLSFFVPGKINPSDFVLSRPLFQMQWGAPVPLDDVIRLFCLNSAPCWCHVATSQLFKEKSNF